MSLIKTLLVLSFLTQEVCVGFTTLPPAAYYYPVLCQSNTICFSSTSDDDAFMDGLRMRMNEVKESATKLPLVCLDSMLPRQVLEIRVENPLFAELVMDRVRKETPVFGMLGVSRLITGQSIRMKHGVEVEIVEKEILNHSNQDSSSCLRLVLKAGRRFSIVGDVDTVEQGWTEGRVKFHDSGEQEVEEATMGDDHMSVVRAISKCRELTTPNNYYSNNNNNNMSLVDRWVQLAKENEKTPGQIDRLLNEIGEIPPEDEPTERALWVGALINPIPAMGVAMEVRPSLLIANSAEQRVQVALDAIHKSIKHMDGSERMW